MGSRQALNPVPYCALVLLALLLPAGHPQAFLPHVTHPRTHTPTRLHRPIKTRFQRQSDLEALVCRGEGLGLAPLHPLSQLRAGTSWRSCAASAPASAPWRPLLARQKGHASHWPKVAVSLVTNPPESESPPQHSPPASASAEAPGLSPSRACRSPREAFGGAHGLKGSWGLRVGCRIKIKMKKDQKKNYAAQDQKMNKKGSKRK